MKARLLIALPFLFACSSSSGPPGDTGTGGTSSGTTSGGAGGGGQQISSCGPDPGTLSPAPRGRRYDTKYLNALSSEQITVDGNGEMVLLARIHTGTIDFGTGAPLGEGPALAAYDATGAPLAAVSMNAFGANGAVFLGADLYTVSIDEATFDLVFEKRFAALASAWSKHVGVVTKTPLTYVPPLTGRLVETPDGNLVFAGAASDLSLQIGATAMTFGEPDAFAVALDPDGEVLWAVQLGLVFDMSTQGQPAMIRATAVGSSGAIAFAGATQTAFPRPFLAKLDGDGSVLWSRILPSPVEEGAAEIGSLAVTPDGSVIANGNWRGTVDFGGGPVTTGPNWSYFAARYDPTGALARLAMATDGCADPLIVGWTKSGELAVLGAGVEGALYTGTLDPMTLTPSYERGYAISAAYVSALTVAPSGSTVVSGAINGPSDFGQGPVTPTNVNELQPFLAVLP